MRRIYFNLHRRGWSILNPATGRVENKGTVTPHILLRDVTFKVYEHRRLKVIAEGRKNVHAFACGEIVDADPLAADAVVPISYNPYKAGYFVRKDQGHEGEAVTGCRLLIMTTREVDGKRIPQLFAAL